MCSAKSNRRGWRLGNWGLGRGLRASLLLWTTLVSSTALLAGACWIHFNLRYVLEYRLDQFLERKLSELRATALEQSSQTAFDRLATEMRHVASAYRDQRLTLIVRGANESAVAPDDEAGRQVAERLDDFGVGAWPRTIKIAGDAQAFRISRAIVVTSDESTLHLEIAISLAESEATLDQFDRLVAGGAIVFLGIAILGGLRLTRRALRPVAQSIATAQRLNPEDLSARLPRTGANDELDQLAETINDMRDRLADYHEQINRFTADASHELRGPLTAMRATIEVALQKPRGVPEYQDILGLLAEQCERLAGLANDLLLLAKADAGKMPLQSDLVDLAAIIDDVVEIYQPLAEENGVLLTCHRAAPLTLKGDQARLRQLLSNLVDNAIKFTPSDGGVTIDAQRRGGQIALAITDTGRGIPPAALVHIFERFFQVDAARATRGTGLGLSICHWIATAHAGTIEVTSTMGSGSTFTVLLPMANAINQIAAPAPSAAVGLKTASRE